MQYGCNCANESQRQSSGARTEISALTVFIYYYYYYLSSVFSPCPPLNPPCGDGRSPRRRGPLQLSASADALAAEVTSRRMLGTPRWFSCGCHGYAGPRPTVVLYLSSFRCLWFKRSVGVVVYDPRPKLSLLDRAPSVYYYG